MNFPENNPFLDNMMIRIHNLIKTKTTGTPKQLARKLGCSERTIFNKIALLKQSGFPVFYSPQQKSYYYPLEVALHFSISLDGAELLKIMGGKNRRPEDKKNDCNFFAV